MTERAPFDPATEACAVLVPKGLLRPLDHAEQRVLQASMVAENLSWMLYGIIDTAPSQPPADEA